MSISFFKRRIQLNADPAIPEQLPEAGGVFELDVGSSKPALVWNSDPLNTPRRAEAGVQRREEPASDSSSVVCDWEDVVKAFHQVKLELQGDAALDPELLLTEINKVVNGSKRILHKQTCECELYESVFENDEEAVGVATYVLVTPLYNE